MLFNHLLLAATAMLGAVVPSAIARPSSTAPPANALVVRQTSPRSGEYSSISAAISALGTTGTAAKSIFIYAGTYKEQVTISYPGSLTIIGQTSAPTTYRSNLVTITNNLAASNTGDDDSSGTLRVHKNDFTMYNINVANTYGHPAVQSQALALSATGLRQGFYGCSFSGYQDTVLTDAGTQYFGASAVTGAVDYIFGETAASYFKHCDLFSSGAGSINAGRPKGSTTPPPGIYVFDSCTVAQAPSATSSLTGQVFLGRPWGNYARSIWMFSSLSDVVNSAGWSVWASNNPQTDHVTYAEYMNTGAGAAKTSTSRASWSQQQLSASQASTYAPAKVLGSDWTSWVDQSYV